MTDSEINRLCAVAMGWHTGPLASKVVPYKVNDCAIIAGNDRGGESVYDPLHDDAQCFALVKKFRLRIAPMILCTSKGNSKTWMAEYCTDSALYGYESGADLNRAICECVANCETHHFAP